MFNVWKALTSFSADQDLGAVSGGPAGKYPTKLIAYGTAANVLVLADHNGVETTFSMAERSHDGTNPVGSLTLENMRVKEVADGTNCARVVLFWENVPGNHPRNA